ncbi:microtubule-associated protein 1 light chain 3 beta-like [Diabrotica undecimpunctata]|uniref:microtubule-associated protein 1 light chain 3 beta-like n=1 Tax=Diabrotica undecimpunctata TaxID=50387 RepID=UPI003B6407B2
MYSKLQENSLNSLKLCECDNNNLCSVKIMNKLFNDNKKQKKETNLNNNVSKKPVKTIEIRKEEVLAIRNRFPTKIPIIVQRFYKETHLPHLDKSKFLVPQEITMSQFQTIIRNRIRLNSHQALYLLVNNRSMMSLTLTLAEVYAEHADSDGFLYVTYASQEVFGDATTVSNYEVNKCMIEFGD